MAYTDFDSYTLDELNALHAVIVIAINDLVGGQRAVKFVIDGDLVSYTPIELPQLRQLLADVGAAVALKDAGSSGAITSFKISTTKGL